MQIVGLTMPYTDASGDAHPNAFAYPVMHTEDRLAMQGSVTWYLYRDAVAFLAGLQLVGEHTVQVDKATFLAGAAMPPQGASNGANAGALDVFLALNVKDTPTLDASGRPVLDASGLPVMQSFFAGATVVSITVPDGA